MRMCIFSFIMQCRYCGFDNDLKSHVLNHIKFMSKKYNYVEILLFLIFISAAFMETRNHKIIFPNIH